MGDLWIRDRGGSWYHKEILGFAFEYGNRCDAKWCMCSFVSDAVPR